MLNSFNCFLTMTLMGPLQLFILGALLFPNIQSRWTAEIKQKDRKKVCVPLCMLLVETSSVNQISLVLCFSFHPKAIRGELLLEIRAVLLCFDGNMRPILITRPNISLSLSRVNWVYCRKINTTSSLDCYHRHREGNNCNCLIPHNVLHTRSLILFTGVLWILKFYLAAYISRSEYVTENNKETSM